MNIGVIIPVYNVGVLLEDVLSKVLAYVSPNRIYVIDDGSTDNSADIALKAGVGLIRHEINSGKGEALKSGFKRILEDALDGVITLDGDGQHDPAFIPDFIETAESSSSELVLGVRRFRIGEMPLDRIFSNRTTSLIVSLLSGKKVPDSQCGYRLIRSSVLKGLTLKSSYYETETELLVRAAWKGCKIEFCPVSITYSGEPSHIHRLRDTVCFCRLIVRLILERCFNFRKT
jgi:glycosyltransferase involved in cell wall biosynthesis